MVLILKVKLGLNIRPKDEVYIFVYDKDQIYIPSVSRIYGSDFRKLSDVSTHQTLNTPEQIDLLLEKCTNKTDSIGGSPVWALSILRGLQDFLQGEKPSRKQM